MLRTKPPIAPRTFLQVMRGALTSGGKWAEQIITLNTNVPASKDAGPGAPPLPDASVDAHCAFSALFRPTLAVRQVRWANRDLLSTDPVACLSLHESECIATGLIH